jgi:hypothetical protein
MLMASESVTRLARATFRVSATFELVVVDRLAPHEQTALAELRRDPTFYGVLRPRADSGQTVKAVDKETALLWMTLQTPGTLPFFAWGDDPEATARGIIQLVLDGVLEMQDDGRFVSGPGAAVLFAPAQRAANAGRLARQSQAALRYAESLQLTDSTLLSARLYEYGRQPRSAAWANRLPDSDAVLSFVGAGSGTLLRRRLDEEWRSSEASSRSWLAWSTAHPARREVSATKPTHKLYVSPDTGEMPRAFAAVVDLGASGPAHFKIGADAAGLLRPDKMVLYFADQERLVAGAADLQDALEGAAPHGVPFSSELSGDGLLSWGMDPPSTARVVSWHERESWRLWLARRLAAAMVAADASPDASMGPAAFAVERLRHEGVDVEGWTPSAALWRST